MKVNIRLLVLVIILSLITIGCSRAVDVKGTQTIGLDISSMSTGIGAVDQNNNSHDIQRFSYSINLANNDKDTAFIKEVTLVLPKEFEEALVTKQLPVTVNTELAPKSTIEIKGSLDFKANGLSKDQIIKLNPKILSIKVTNERTISLEKWTH